MRERALRKSARAEKRGIVSQRIYQRYSRLGVGDEIRPGQSSSCVAENTKLVPTDSHV